MAEGEIAHNEQHVHCLKCFEIYNKIKLILLDIFLYFPPSLDDFMLFEAELMYQYVRKD